jgi:putative transposase
MSVPRRIVPGTFWLLTRRCTQRQFLLRPGKKMNNAFLYCLIEAARETGIVLLLPQMMSNHEHTVLYDPNGNIVEFMHRFHSHLARCVNALRERGENVWSSEPPSLVELADADAVVDRLIYTATNPVKDGLVDSVHHWPGPRTVQAFLTGRTVRAQRPEFVFRSDGPMPESVEVTFVIPEQLGPREVIVERVRRGIAIVEEECALERARTHRQVIGRRRVLLQSWRDNPNSPEPRRTLRPRVAARSKWARMQALQRNKEFESRYHTARKLWLEGMPAKFPEGTYWLRKYANVEIESAVRPQTPC